MYTDDAVIYGFMTFSAIWPLMVWLLQRSCRRAQDRWSDEWAAMTESERAAAAARRLREWQ